MAEHLKVLAALAGGFIASPGLQGVGHGDAVYPPNMSYWGGFTALAGVPAPIIETLRREIAAAVMFPAVRERTEADGTVASFSASSADFVKKIAYDLEWMGNAVKTANLNLS